MRLLMCISKICAAALIVLTLIGVIIGTYNRGIVVYKTADTDIVKVQTEVYN